ncbi:zinc knuckle CX2CX4HX4C containing protein [Tanacetum coccineum]
MNHQLLDSHGSIPGMKPVEGLITIQTMADHSQKWHNGSPSQSVCCSKNSKGMAAITSKLDNLSRDMKKLKESVHAIRVGCQLCGGPHLDKECPLNEEVRLATSVRRQKTNLTKTINKYMEEMAKRHVEQDEWLKKLYLNTETSQRNHDKIIQSLETKVKTLTNKVEGKMNKAKFEECKAIYMEDGTPLYIPFHYSSKEIKYFSASLGLSDNETQEDEIMEDSKWLPPKEEDPGSFILPYSIERLDFNNALADLGPSISIMPFFMYKRLGIGNIKPINMVIEMADNTKSFPKGIVKNLLIKIDKFIFPVDFVILDMIEDFRMPIILGRPLLATAHAKVDIFKKTISLEVGNEKVIFKMRSRFSTIIFESVRAIKSEIHIKDDDSEPCDFNQLLGIDHDIFAYDINMQGSYKEANTNKEKFKEYEIVEQCLNPAEKRAHWCEALSQEKEGLHKYWASCDPHNDICDGGSLPNNVERRYWESTNDNERVDLEWKEYSFNNWVRIKFSKVCKMTKDRILEDYWRKVFNEAELENEKKVDSKEYGESKTNAIL